MTEKVNALISAIPFRAIRSGCLNLLFVGGIGLADYGIYLIHRPAAVIFGGLAIAGCAVILSGDNEPHRENPQGD